MSAPCSDDFQRLADRLGGIDCEAAEPIVSLRAPWELANWTLPVVEALMVIGALFALAHAVASLRRQGQPGWIGLWVATGVYVVILEPPLYFPEAFGIDEHVGLIFVHNVFTVDFLYDRLPLYIFCLYPAGIYLAHALVDRLGVFQRHGIIVGAVTAGFVHHCFYEIFDNLGPQLRWWAWNADVATNEPSLGSVPLSSVVMFAAIGPALVVALTRRLLFDGNPRAGLRVGLRSLVVGLLTPVLLPLAGLPVTIVLAPEDPNEAVAAAVMYATIALFGGIALWAVLTSVPRRRTWGGIIDGYALIHGAIYLLTFTVLWAAALPELVRSDGGTTSSGTPIGNPAYVFACAVTCIWLLARAAPDQEMRSRPEAATDDAALVRPGPR